MKTYPAGFGRLSVRQQDLALIEARARLARQAQFRKALHKFAADDDRRGFEVARVRMRVPSVGIVRCQMARIVTALREGLALNWFARY